MVRCKALLLGLHAIEASGLEQASAAIQDSLIDFAIVDEEFKDGLPLGVPAILLIDSPRRMPANISCVRKPVKLARLLEAATTLLTSETVEHPDLERLAGSVDSYAPGPESRSFTGS